MADHLLEAEAVSRSFLLRPRTPFARRRLLHAVTGVSLSVGVGETVGLVGESGSGKSTFGRVAAGILPASAGSVRRRTSFACGSGTKVKVTAL